jgi:predicted nucleic acid-binding protein
MIVLDTNILSELMKPKGSEVVRQWVAKQPMMNLFITTITQADRLYRDNKEAFKVLVIRSLTSSK